VRTKLTVLCWCKTDDLRNLVNGYFSEKCQAGALSQDSRRTYCIHLRPEMDGTLQPCAWEVVNAWGALSNTLNFEQSALGTQCSSLLHVTNNQRTSAEAWSVLVSTVYAMQCDLHQYCRDDKHALAFLSQPLLNPEWHLYLYDGAVEWARCLTTVNGAATIWSKLGDILRWVLHFLFLRVSQRFSEETASCCTWEISSRSEK